MTARRLAAASTRSRAVASVLIVLLAALTLGVAHVPGAYGAFLAKVTNDSDTVGTAVGCTAWAQGSASGSAFFAYPLGESATTTLGGKATDVSGNNNTGAYSALGVTGGQSTTGVCGRDGYTGVQLNGVTGAIYGPSSQTDPINFTEEIWFKTVKSYALGGKLIGLGNSQTGLSGNYDRHLYLDNAGHVVFGVYPGSVQTVVSPNTYNDGGWHFAVATLCDPTTYAQTCPAKGMTLYVDGVKVNSNTGITTSQNFTGYWRIGYDNMANWNPQPTNNAFQGYLAWASVYNTAVLSGTQVAAQYAAGTS